MTAEEFLLQWHDDSPMVIAQTSGSTGTPKLIELYKDDMAQSARATCAFFGLGQGATFVCPMDFRYIGSRMMAVRAEACGGKLIAISPSNNYDFDTVADLLAIVPSQVDCLVASPKLVSLTRNVIIGGASLDRERRRRLIEAGVNAWTTYGMTETCSHVALAKVTDASDEVFEALPDVVFSLDKRGCLVITMPGRRVSEVVTNDLVRLIDESHFVWLGRYDNVINSGGIKIHPETVEAVCTQLFPDAPMSVTAVPDPKWGETAVLVVPDDYDKADGEILDTLREALPDSRHCPKRVVRIDAIPLTANGKIDRSALKVIIEKAK